MFLRQTTKPPNCLIEGGLVAISFFDLLNGGYNHQEGQDEGDGLFAGFYLTHFDTFLKKKMPL